MRWGRRTPDSMGGVELMVPAARLERWVANFEGRHGDTWLDVRDRCLYGEAVDGSSFSAAAPFDRGVDAPDLGTLTAACAPPASWGVLLVRKGGFAVARLAGDRVVESKVGQRHVQGRTKAGGQSQQRFARRRDNQARAAYEAAADHAARILGAVPVLVVGGDHTAVAAVLEDSRLRAAREAVQGPFLTVPDPRRGVLESAIRDACSVRIDVTNA
jgi:Actinobacteria/chloroflexi VLRF1 release factor